MVGVWGLLIKKDQELEAVRTQQEKANAEEERAAQWSFAKVHGKAMTKAIVLICLGPHSKDCPRGVTTHIDFLTDLEARSLRTCCH